MKKEIIIKRVYYLVSIIDYVFIPIRVPTWLLENWFTNQYGGYYYLSPITDESKDLILNKLDSNSYSSREELYIIKTVKAFSNKIITLNTARDLIEHSRTLTSLKYAPILVWKTSYLGGDKTFRVKLGTDLIIKGIDPSIDEIFTKLIQDEEKL